MSKKRNTRGLSKFLRNLCGNSPKNQERPEEFGGTEAANKGFEPLYSEVDHESLPWFWRGMDPDFERLMKTFPIPGKRVLDIGTGSGMQAIALASQGFETWATDFSGAALEYGRKEAGKASVDVNFIVDDACNSKLSGNGFDVVFDRGCFHVLPPQQRGDYVRSVASLLEPGRLLFLKCFSNEEPPRPGPFRFSPEEIESIFQGHFEILRIEKTEFHGSRPVHPKALCSVMRRS